VRVAIRANRHKAPKSLAPAVRAMGTGSHRAIETSTPISRTASRVVEVFGGSRLAEAAEPTVRRGVRKSTRGHGPASRG